MQQQFHQRVHKQNGLASYVVVSFFTTSLEVTITATVQLFGSHHSPRFPFKRDNKTVFTYIVSFFTYNQLGGLQYRAAIESHHFHQYNKRYSKTGFAFNINLLYRVQNLGYILLNTEGRPGVLGFNLRDLPLYYLFIFSRKKSPKAMGSRNSDRQRARRTMFR